MTRLGQYFRRNVVGSSTGGVPSFSWMVESSTEPEISDFDFHLVVQKDVAEFHVSVDDALAMQVLQPVDELQQVVLGLKFRDPDAVPHKL
jgi:hypothetical protein